MHTTITRPSQRQTMKQSLTGTQHEATMFMLKQSVITQMEDHVLVRQCDSRITNKTLSVFNCIKRTCRAKFYVSKPCNTSNIVTATIVRNHNITQHLIGNGHHPIVQSDPRGVGGNLNS